MRYEPSGQSSSWCSRFRAGRILAVVVVLAGPASGQGFTPEAASKRMTIPDGLGVRVVAHEPMVRQPVCIEFDDRGRLWVIQYLQYPNPAGLKRVSVDRFSRTKYDVVPEPPPRGPKGADRITILEDLDGDGKADRSKDFLDGLNLASGLAFGRGGVFVLQVPYLLFYADKDRDDVPDGDPEVLLTGFGMDDAHSVANSLTWGPDGWLYGLQGSTVTADVRGVAFQQGVWRYHPVSRRFELFCEGGGNMWGLDFDRRGRLFASTNVGAHAALHAVQGAYCWKSFGKHGPLHNPYAYGYFDHIPHEGSPREGHVTVGGLFYEADAFPARYRGKFIAGDLLGHAVRWHGVSEQGSSVRTRLEGDLVVANDTWFATTDLTLGPDGAVYVADFSDKRTAHPDPDADWDRSNGRIYAVHANGRRPPAVPDLAALHSDKLIDMLSHPNVWYVRRARRILAERREPEALARLRALSLRPNGGRETLEAVWTLASADAADEALLALWLGNHDEDVRTWAVRLIGDREPIASRKNLADKILVLATTEPSSRVRAQIAGTARRLDDMGLPIASRLIDRDIDSDDPHIPLLLWWAIEPRVVSDCLRLLERFGHPAGWRSKINREAILPRIVRRLVAEGAEKTDREAARFLDSAPSVAERRSLFEAVEAGLPERPSRDRRAAPELVGSIGKDWTKSPDDPRLTVLAVQLGVPSSRAKAVLRAEDDKAAESSRAALVRVLDDGQGAVPEGFFLSLATGPAPISVQVAALEALARDADPKVAGALLSVYPKKSPTWRAKARGLLLGRKSGANCFLKAVEAGSIDPAEVPVDDLKAVALHHDPALDALVRKHWGAVTTGTPEETLAEIRRLSNDLRAKTGNAATGKRVFGKHCATCHTLHGEGKKVGPDLTHANRGDKDYLLVSLVDPSAVVRKEFQGSVVATKDGRVLTGLVDESDPNRIVVLLAGGETTAVARSEVETIQASPTSLMPDNLYRQFSPDDLRDLFAYLARSQP